MSDVFNLSKARREKGKLLNKVGGRNDVAIEEEPIVEELDTLEYLADIDFRLSQLEIKKGV